ncbi:nucleotide exchange factor GrpE [Hazenella sp. IB182357]|uniref:Protein GrpE n=1 Tax=Polycladospora coralii TaxID=2771432 RepID=A0A926N5R5_9BACL|nr:nucleotide exchange factor GrpE [Polycladospora coralii]MBS7530083.1 nucleotide exchange factor GrpE [Polycladospora coralii]
MTSNQEESVEMNQHEDVKSEEHVDEGLHSELAQLRKALEESETASQKWKALAEENENKHLKAVAELENFRRRARKDREDTLKYASVPLLESLLPVLDNFERALDAADQSEDTNVLKDGVEMVYRQFLNALSEAGLVLIEAEGKPFNPHEHNAVAREEQDKVESDIVLEEFQAGYRYLDRVIRPSMVKVSN